MIGKLLARILPGEAEVSDPREIQQYHREEVERRTKIERERPLVRWLTENLAATVERNHFGPDIDLALRVDTPRKR